MTIRELLDALAARGSRVAADGEHLRHVGPRFAEGDPVRRALTTFHDEILHLVVTGRLCCFCPRLLATGDRIACAQHRVKIKDAQRGRGLPADYEAAAENSGKSESEAAA